jgi:hypothetical protein
MKNITIIYIIFSLVIIGCKKEVQPTTAQVELKRIEIRSDALFVKINGDYVYPPALFYWKVGEKYKIKAYSRYGGSFAGVYLTIHKDLNLDVELEGRDSVTIDYEVKP